MSISELIQHVGDAHIELQNIMGSSPTLRQGKRDGTVTFHTDKSKVHDLMIQAATGTRGQWTALVIFLPTEKLPQIKKEGDPS